MTEIAKKHLISTIVILDKTCAASSSIFHRNIAVIMIFDTVNIKENLHDLSDDMFVNTFEMLMWMKREELFQGNSVIKKISYVVWKAYANHKSFVKLLE